MQLFIVPSGRLNHYTEDQFDYTSDNAKTVQSLEYLRTAINLIVIDMGLHNYNMIIRVQNSIAKKCFDIWGILKMATGKSFEPRNHFVSINHIIKCAVQAICNITNFLCQKFIRIHTNSYEFRT